MPLSTDPTRKAEKHVLQNNNQNSLKIQFPASFLKPKSVIRLAECVSCFRRGMLLCILFVCASCSLLSASCSSLRLDVARYAFG